MSKPELLRKQVSFDVDFKADLPENHGRGAAACIGNMDRGGDVIFPGAFSKKVLQSFLKSGFISLGHDWSGNPIGYPIAAKEQRNQLVCEWQYHSTDDAQEARQWAIERLSAGKDVGLSIGFQIDFPDGRAWFGSGSELLKYAEDNGYDMSLFDTKSIKACKECRGIFSVSDLFEFSQVTVPMNPSAVAIAVKGDSKSQSNTVGALLQAKIHQAFSVAADELAIRGYLDVPERISLSSNISSALQTFAALIDPELAVRAIDSVDVDWIASKADPATESSASAHAVVTSRARALRSQADFVLANL